MSKYEASCTSDGTLTAERLANVANQSSCWYLGKEGKSAESKSRELGITTATTDDRDDSNLVLSAVAAPMGQIVAPSQNMGPVIATYAATAGIQAIAAASPLNDDACDAYPLVGFGAASSVEHVDTELGRLLTEARADPIRPNTVSIEDHSAPAFLTRYKAAQAYPKKPFPGVSGTIVVHIAYKNDPHSAIHAMAPVATSGIDINFRAICSGNDVGVARDWPKPSTQVVDPSQVFGVGLVGEHSCQIVNDKGAKSGFSATYAGDPAFHAAKAVELLYNFLTKGEAVPATTIRPGIMAAPDRFGQVMVDRA